jgi:hypothetical protein
VLRRWFLHQQEKPGKILPVVLDRFAQDVGAIPFRCRRGSDAGSVRQVFLHKHLHASRRIVKGSLFEFRMLLEESQALVQRHRVGVDATDLFKRHSWCGDQVVDNPDVRLPDNWEVVVEEMVVILMHRAVQCVFDWHHCSRDFSRFQALKDVGEFLARINRDIVA